MGLGFWSGANKYMNNKIEREERREEFLMEQLTRTKAMVLPEIMKRMDEKRSRVKTRQARVAAATDYGFSPITALTLEKTGQLEFELNKLDKLGPSKVDRGYIESLDAYITTHLDPNDPNFNARLAKSVRSGLNVDTTSESGQLAGLMKAAQATTQDDLNSAIASMSTGINDSVPYSGASIEYNTLRGEKVSDTRRKQIKNSIAQSIQPLIANSSFATNETTNGIVALSFTNKDHQKILDSVVDSVITSYIEPEVFSSDQLVISEAVELVGDYYQNSVDNTGGSTDANHFNDFTVLLDQKLTEETDGIDLWKEYLSKVPNAQTPIPPNAQTSPDVSTTIDPIDPTVSGVLVYPDQDDVQ